MFYYVLKENFDEGRNIFVAESCKSINTLYLMRLLKKPPRVCHREENVRAFNFLLSVYPLSC